MRVQAAAAGLGLLLLGCRAPWTVRPIQDVEAAATGGAVFDAAKFVDSIWQSKAVPAAEQAGGFAEWRAGGMARAALVQGRGSVVRRDEAGQVLLLNVEGGGQADVAVRFGEIRGTALRDALPFIQFGQFVNQVEYARASSALNARAEKTAAALAGDGSAGTAVRFGGVAVAPVAGGRPEVIPIFLARENGR